MARSNSFNKRDIEKSKQQKRKEKQKRKEERKKESPNSFEDMIAYVDANGNITDTPPDPAKEEEVALEDIDISTPKKADEPEITDFTGKVDFYDSSKGFGFIRENIHGEKYFFHRSNVSFEIQENDAVSFKLEQGPRGLNAVNVDLIPAKEETK